MSYVCVYNSIYYIYTHYIYNIIVLVSLSLYVYIYYTYILCSLRVYHCISAAKVLVVVHISLDLGHDVLGLRETPHQGVHTHDTLKLGGWILWPHQWTNSSRYGFAESVDESSLTSLSCVATWYFKSSILGMATSLSLSHPPKQCNFITCILQNVSH